MTTSQVYTEWIEYQSGGETISGYFASPEGDTAGLPAIIMVHENPGIKLHRQDDARQMAAQGYVVLVPNLYSRVGGKMPTGATDLERKLKITLAVPDEQVFQDLLSAAGTLRTRWHVDMTRLGLMGFCMGGSKGFYAVTHSDLFRCFVSFYGPPIARAENQPDGQDHSYLPFAQDLTCPMQYHVGDKDTTCGIQNVRALEAALHTYGKDVQFFVYPGAQHAFHDETGERYHAESAPVAWQRALEFFARYLQPAAVAT